jgi:hypothetical protein
VFGLAIKKGWALHFTQFRRSIPCAIRLPLLVVHL